MALAADKKLELMFPNVGHIAAAKSNVVDTYYKGALVAFNASGFLVVAADTAGLRFAGIVKEQVVVAAAETKDLEVIRGTLAWIPHSGAAQADVGKLFYASADDAIADFGVQTDPIGKCVGWKTGFLLIDMRQAEPKVRYGEVAVTGTITDIDTGLRVIKHAVASVKSPTQGAGEAAYFTLDHGADGLLDLYGWDDAGAAATVATTATWMAIGE